jgi:phytanoyl-CoA hydroxylase
MIEMIENKDKIVKAFNRDGYIVIRKLLKKEEIIKVRNSLSKFIKKYTAKETRDINLIDSSTVNSIHQMDEWIWTKKIRKNSKLRGLAYDLLEGEIIDFGSELFAKPAKLGLKSPPHQDNFYWCLSDAAGITVWIALDKSSRFNGGVYYYKGSHKLGLISHKNSYAPGSSQTLSSLKPIRNLQKITPSLDAGDCLIHHSLVVHGSEVNESLNSRIGLTVRYKSINSFYDDNMKNHYEKELMKQIKKRKLP